MENQELKERAKTFCEVRLFTNEESFVLNGTQTFKAYGKDLIKRIVKAENPAMRVIQDTSDPATTAREFFYPVCSGFPWGGHSVKRLGTWLNLTLH